MKRALAMICMLFISAGADWPQFRGEGARGVSDEKNLPTTWSDAENVTWKTPLPGYGASSPITWGGKIFLTAYSGYGTKEGGELSALKRHLVCVDGDGKILWDTQIDSAGGARRYSGFVSLHGYASHTPATDGERVYAYFGAAGAVAVDSSDGKVLWRADCGGATHGFGTGASPILYENTLIVNAGVESRTLVALNKETGEEAWRGGNINQAWNTPLLVNAGERRELIVSMKNRLIAYDPRSGVDLWHCDGIRDYVCPSAVAHEGIIYAIGGRGRVGLAVRAGGKGDVTETHRLYELKRGSNVSSPTYHEGRLYWAHEGNGICYCANAETGEIVYEQRLRPSPGRIYASPLAADGKIYYVSRENGTYVLALGDEFKQIAHNTLDSDESVFNASPVVLDGKFILRSDENLYAIGEKGS